VPFRPLKRALRRRGAPSFLRRYDRLRLELPVRLRDLPADLVESVRPSVPHPVPPAWLRRHVGRTSSRDEYVRVGRVGFQEIAEAFRAHRDERQTYPRWLDFGCGCGRLCRYLPAEGLCESVWGADVDADAILWNTRHLRPGHFQRIAPTPPTPFAPGSFDVVFAVSVFTHLDEMAQWAWLAELTRLLRPGGLLLASTHSETLAPTRPDLSAEDVQRLASSGFAFAPGARFFNDDTAFHSQSYVERTWSQWLTLLGFYSFGLFHYQDLSVWRKPDGSAS
jgi:SAM-dependent methyltransferase